MVSEKTVERLSLYRRVLQQLRVEGKETIMSHELAMLLHIKPSQVRRDIMQLGYSGVPNSGYKIRPLLESIANFLDSPLPQSAVLVGVGHLGLALLANFAGRWRQLAIRASFDKDPEKVGQTFHGCKCYPMSELTRVVNETKSMVGIIAIPGEGAQNVCDLLIHAGIRGILNFSPLRVKVPDYVFVEHVDLSATFEKVAFFARRMKHYEKEEYWKTENDNMEEEKETLLTNQ
ncbi:MAG TPA: redox-sensing transcriptional repressor Rex [Candidatus Hydrogenedens sp.]|nr:redox-sensing transcriptional repressor Rex [Candidatus Hydrogenedens sp.]HOK10461.1 redox-sensing transcriptional repressor Rex [Candidatus Hydrogenedens sp.]HOL19927.1 redox-sensing transcriptional repressor Rex [Candidatus Hydrogenedens sp.]HPP59485.1 redox-sensing transcriptional repressor Rex [Candidatus Hydrogenedens sp.]